MCQMQYDGKLYTIVHGSSIDDNSVVDIPVSNDLVSECLKDLDEVLRRHCFYMSANAQVQREIVGAVIAFLAMGGINHMRTQHVIEAYYRNYKRERAECAMLNARGTGLLS